MWIVGRRFNPFGCGSKLSIKSKTGVELSVLKPFKTIDSIMNLATRSARASASDRLAGCERTVAYTSSRPPIIVPCSIVSAPVLGFGVLRFGVWGLGVGVEILGLEFMVEGSGFQRSTEPPAVRNESQARPLEVTSLPMHQVNQVLCILWRE